MCGIVGAIGGGPDARRAPVERAVRALRHRGPDGQGCHHDEHVTLGHTRLAIIDPGARSDQPIVDEASGCVLVFNGEIYNYVELREELSDRQRFRSQGDGEVLLRAYLEWGLDALPRLNGMFAVALWDPRDGGRLVLARDRLGEKPLHLARTVDALWFSSEIKGLVAAGVAGRHADRDAVFAFLALGDVADPGGTFFDDVTQLGAGEVLEVTPTRDERRRPYWQLPRPEAARSDPARSDSAARATAEAFAELFTDSVRLRLRSDVPVGTSLSGGLDSTAVVATMRQLHPAGELHAFTASFPGSAADELDRARAVADELGLTIHPVPLDGRDLAAGLDDLIATHEGPVGSPSVFAQARVMASAHAAGITVLLDGQGADESWLGYDVYAGASLLDDALTGHPARARRMADRWRSVRGARLVPPIARYLGLVLPPAARRRAVRASLARESWLSPAYRAAHRDVDPLAAVPRRASRPGRVAVDYAALDTTRLLLPRLLQYADRNSMASSREVRLPFLDHRLVELASRTPLDQRLVDGWTKEPVRRLLESLGQPTTARRRDKLAYQPPHDAWMDEPEMAERTRAAWARLHADGALATPTPHPSPLVRWRVLAVERWADAYGLSVV